MTTPDDWVKAAMADDAIVVHLLVTLHNTPPQRHALPLQWTVRQRRSKSISLSSKSKRPPPHRASPTTPLSWSAAANSQDSTSPTERSKVNIHSEKQSSKRSRKKTLPELKEEEVFLMKERRELKRELAALRCNLEAQTDTNEKLKRMKNELQPRSESTSGPDSSCHTTPILAMPPVLNEDAMLESSTTYAKLALPDLNIPLDKPS